MKQKRIKCEQLVIAPCTEACPAGIDVPRYIRCIRGGRFDEALAVIRERIPFPSICGHACYSPCEAQCGNRQFGEAIAIRALKRAAAERGGELWRKNLRIAPATGKRVAVVGSGPSGLTAAYYLATLGHKVTVLEALEEPGGMMRMGIPKYRLPREALDKEIAYLKDIGIEIKTGAHVDSINALFQQGYNAVYLACGAQKGARLGIPGEDSPGVIDGISFLREVNRDKRPQVGSRVAVIGGGNTAVDAARCAIRLGAQEVTLIYRRSQNEMTAYEEEVSAAVAEGVKLQFLASPVSFAQKKSGVEVTLTRMELGKPDSGGRPKPVPVQGSEYTMDVDAVIVAVGQVADVPQKMGVAMSERNTAAVNAETLETNAKGVFAGGDMVSGPASIIEAIASGRGAAASIDRFLGGAGIIDQPLAPAETEVEIDDLDAQEQVRVSIAHVPVSERVGNFQPVEAGLTEEMAIREARRCRDCDARQFELSLYSEGCKECGYCIEVCGMNVFDVGTKFNKRGYRSVLIKNRQRCVGCRLCFYACPDFSIDVAEANLTEGSGTNRK